jgi:glyoxylase-like metal-dependent hydrolase (beta-lactamase superfamily II)
MQAARQVTPDIHIIPSEFPAPGIGVLPVNAYVIKAREPMLVDAGLEMDAGAFMDELESIIDPQDIRWVYLTHPDRDHVGSLMEVLDRAPDARLVTTYLGYGTLGLSYQVPMERVYFLNPGEELDIGDRRITALRPPTFDSPATTGFWDAKTRSLFTADSFGAVLPETPEEAGDMDEAVLRGGQVLWTTVDSPWLHKVDRGMLAAELTKIRQMEPEVVYSAHLPPARSMTDWMIESLVAAPEANEFVGPNQAALEAMMAQMTGAPA